MSSVTIVIPCFNAGDVLLESVESAAAQSHPDVRVVVVDDGSTDPATLAALDAVRTATGVAVVDAPHRGAPAARNTGIRLAPADYVQPLDADDRLSPDYVARAVERLDADPGLGVVYGPAEFFGTRTGPFDLPEFSAARLAVNNLVHVGGMYRYADWERVGGYREDLQALQDYDLWIRMHGLGRRFEMLPGITYYYRQGRNRITDSYAGDVDRQAARYADVFRVNADFFVAHAEDIYRHRFAIERRMVDAETLIARISTPRGSLRWAAGRWARAVQAVAVRTARPPSTRSSADG